MDEREDQDIRERMPVYGPDGRRLGWVTGVGDGHFEMERTRVGVDVEDVSERRVRDVRDGEQVVLEDGIEDVKPVHDSDGGALPPPGSEHMNDETH